MLKRFVVRSALPVAFFLLPAAALAHTGHADTAGLAAGLAHPLSGWDHLLAMVALGLWAGQMGGGARWTLPLAFVVVMLVGAAVGFAGLAVPGVEGGILASVLLLGLLVAGAARLPLMASLPLAGLFALFHGVAHGGEMPAMVSGLGYALGFAVTTALLHLSGVGLAGALSAARREFVLRAAGAGVAFGGLLLALG